MIIVKKIRGTKQRPRLRVFRSLKFIYAQVINDDIGHTLVSSFGDNPEKIGAKIAEKCLKNKIKKIVFDRGKYRYQGKVKILAEAARKGGLKF
ncbi:MAG: 50S ribosomal protein L18 [bacterium]